jgi:hypothetical protein
MRCADVPPPKWSVAGCCSAFSSTTRARPKSEALPQRWPPPRLAQAFSRGTSLRNEYGIAVQALFLRDCQIPRRAESQSFGRLRPDADDLPLGRAGLWPARTPPTASWISVSLRRLQCRAKGRNVDWQAAVRRLQPAALAFYATCADCQSAIQQTASLRYFESAALICGLELLQSFHVLLYSPGQKRSRYKHLRA